MKNFLLRRVAPVLAALLAIPVVILSAATLRYEKHRRAVYDRTPSIDLAREMRSADVALGKRIVEIRNACTDCHGTDLGGRVFVDGPPGRFAGPNLTPSALASWSDAQIARAIRYGVGKDGRSLRIMPSDTFQHLSKQDVASVIAFLRSVPAVERPPVEMKIGALAKVLHLFGKMPSLFAAEAVDRGMSFEEKPVEGATLAFGKYMVRTSCMGCHGASLAGGRIPGTPPDWPPAADLRPSAIGAWSEDAFIHTLRTGVNPSGKKLRAPMPIELTRRMNDTELKAMWSYLRAPY